ncbi:DUF262 domain-containing protein [Hyphomonas sp.]|uniref:DUF262 domain-containing protein n=1 Tax=Hyphomonas sp. TaxID=87 RepID=UPI003F6F3785
MNLSATEELIWNVDQNEATPKLDDRAINERYARGEGRIVVEQTREKLPSFVEQLRNPEYMDLRPFYQRRPRWTVERQSLLIESFIMNIPVPPIFLYEKNFNSYEVMDGQQRITALRDFYDNKYKLKGLNIWSDLNGRSYKSLPDNIRAGIDRRAISTVVLLKESTENEDEASSLRETVFDRLNTGGIKLERQEIRNALYQGRFNDLLEELTRWDDFRHVWGMPRYVENEIATNEDIVRMPIFAKMGDSELVLRFFALRHVAKYRKGMQGFLDIYMRRAVSFNEEDVGHLRSLYKTTFTIACKIFEEHAFQVFDPGDQKFSGKPNNAFYDAVMIGLLPHLAQSERLIQKRATIIDATKEMFVREPSGTFTGRGNSKADIEQRITKFSSMISDVLSE